ncbi:peptidoglycan-binding protein [Kitasatospora sp. NPDC054939]
MRPYVPQALGQVAPPPAAGPMPGQAPGPMAGVAPAPVPGPVAPDPFATRLAPPTAPAAPYGAPAPQADAHAHATTVLPPYRPGPPPQPPYGAPGTPGTPGAEGIPGAGYTPYPHDPRNLHDLHDTGDLHDHPAPHDLHDPHGPQEPRGGEELGFFPFDAAADTAPGGGRAARRTAGQHPLARRKGLVAAIGSGLLAATVGLAYAVTPSGSDDDRRAQPAPSVTLAPAPADPTTAAPPSPSAEPSATPTASPSPTRTARPSPTATRSASTPASTPATAPPEATTPAAPAPAATPTPSATTTTPAPAPTVRVLKYGMTGDDVLAMQQKLGVVMCWMYVPESGSFDGDTEDAVSYFQRMQGVQGDKRGVFGPNTKAALDKRTGC